MPYIVVVIAFVAILWALPVLERLIKQNRVSTATKWCANTSGDDLRIRLYRLSSDCNIEEQYKIQDNDAEHINRIIADFKRDLESKFFKSKLKPYFCSNKETYFLYLREYMLEKQYDLTISDIPAYIEVESKNNGGLWRSTYEITDFGITYHKVLCLLQTWYIGYKKIDNPQRSEYSDLAETKKAIDDRMLITYYN